MRFVKTLVLGITLAAAGSGLHAQTSPASGTAKKPATRAAANAAPQGAKPAAQTPTKPAVAPASAQNKPAAPASKPAPAKVSANSAAQTAKPSTPVTKPSAKQTTKKSARRTTKPAATAKSTAPAADKETRVAKRDPFESLIGHEQGGGKTGPLPPGKAGLQVSTLRLDGIVRAPTGMIAVVSNPQSRTYFLREGDQLYDGRVEKIAMDGVSFHEVGKDAFGKPVERQVNKRIYASAGEQQ
jgi:Tfp pilus assembly protein PilP